jgi:hypothetical protein
LFDERTFDPHHGRATGIQDRYIYRAVDVLRESEYVCERQAAGVVDSMLDNGTMATPALRGRCGRVRREARGAVAVLLAASWGIGSDPATIAAG